MTTPDPLITDNSPVFPIKVEPGDKRFTLGLVFDVAGVLARHGYPTIARGADLVRLQSALWDVLYGKRESL